MSAQSKSGERGGKNRTTVSHPIDPVYDENSRVLILGSFPSVASRKNGFFYGNARNRFWEVLAELFKEEPPRTNGEKREFLLRRHIALWDVIASCTVVASSDSSISDVRPNDLMPIMKKAKIKAVFVNGKTAEKLYVRYVGRSLGLDAVYLPSTSPANARMSKEDLLYSWRIVKETLNAYEESGDGASDIERKKI